MTTVLIVLTLVIVVSVFTVMIELRQRRRTAAAFDAMQQALVRQMYGQSKDLPVFEGDAERNLQVPFSNPIVWCRICGRPVNEPGADVCGRTHS